MIFEMGQWVLTEDGIGQVLNKVDWYVEEFVELRPYDDFNLGDLYKTFVKVKLYCDFKGKPKKKFKTEYYHGYACENLSKSDIKKLEKSIKKNSSRYEQFLKYEYSENLYSLVELTYDIEIDLFDGLSKVLNDFLREHQSGFTFHELKIKIEAADLGIDMLSFIREGYVSSRGKGITIVLFNSEYQSKNKQRVFQFAKLVK